jgi:carboxyl-terminal processing protease
MKERRTFAIVLFAFLSLCAACGEVVGPNLPVSYTALFDQVWGDFNLHYSLFVVKQINWDSLGAIYRPFAVNATSDGEAASAIAGMLSNLQDDHVLFRGSRVGTSPHGEEFQPTIIAPYLQSSTQLPGGVTYGHVAPSIGYMQVSTFEGTGWLPSVDSALTVLGGANSIIIDVRNNDGGFLENATAMAGRFADRTATVAYVRYRNGPAHTDFAAPIAQQVTPMGTGRFLGDIYLLTSRNTISAAELFVLSMRALGRTRVVGDTTAGETGAPFARELQNGWTYQFPESIEYTVDGKTFEGIGLPPDILVQNTIRAIERGIDSQLARAIILAQGIR